MRREQVIGTLPNVIIDSLSKGMPGTLPATPIADIAGKGWNVLRGDLPMPLAVLNWPAVEQNSRYLSAVTARYEVSLCPHGKTTMAPQLFRKQLDDGCWGITLSTPHQVHVARRYGVQRIFLANQILDPGFLSYVADCQDNDPDFDFYFLVDSVAGLELIRAVHAQRKPSRPFQVLIEIGAPNARAGCRTAGEIMALAEGLSEMAEAAVLVGVEGFEGAVKGKDQIDTEDRINAFLADMVSAAEAIDAAGLFGGREILLTAGGSAYFDLVAKGLSKPAFSKPSRVVLRSGCYIAHDAGMYAELVHRATERSPELAGLNTKLRQALTVWAIVQSRPEKSLLLLNAGRRDVSYDAHLPVPLRWASRTRGMALADLGSGHEVFALNDQHAFVRCPEDSAIQPGDLIELGISHPCTTFDKWDVISLVDDDLNVVGAIKTFF